MAFPITAEQRQQAVDSMMQIVNGDDVPCAIRACQVLIAMQAPNLNADDEPNAKHENRFAEILRRIQTEN